MSGVADRFNRQAQLVPRGRLGELAVSVIGVGAVGRQVALQLASIGAEKLQLIDFDSVELTNVTTQGYRADQIGQSKVGATAADVCRIDSAIAVACECDRFRPRQDVGQAVFACVDSIQVRAAIWRSIRHRCQFYADGRMLGEVIRVLAVENPPADKHYARTLFDQSQAHAGSCTSQATVYAGALAASLMVHQFTRWLRGIPTDADLSLNLLASELVVSP